MEQNDKKFELALWRYGIISPLLHRDANSLPTGALLDHASGQRYVHPNGSHVILSAETIRKWLYRYIGDGLSGLIGQTRSDKGKHKFSDKLALTIVTLRREHLGWTIARIIQELSETGKWNGYTPSRSSIYRFVKTHNLQRSPHIFPKENVRPFSFDHFGQLWTADFLHGPKLFNGKKKQKTYLHAIMDDSSRFIVHGGFYLTESVESLIYDLMGAVRRFGIPQKFYVDNGSAYISRHLKILCARNGVDLIHTPPFVPQGRGKIERFFRTVRDQLLCDRFKTFKEVNDAFKIWVAKYHETLHSTLKCSPLQKRLQSKNVCRSLGPSIDIDAMFRMEKQCRVYNDCTIHFKKNRYEVPGCLPGSHVTIYYMPWDRTCIYYGDEMKKARILDLGANARRFEHPNQ